MAERVLSVYDHRQAPPQYLCWRSFANLYVFQYQLRLSRLSCFRPLLPLQSFSLAWEPGILAKFIGEGFYSIPSYCDDRIWRYLLFNLSVGPVLTFRVTLPAGTAIALVLCACYCPHQFFSTAASFWTKPSTNYFSALLVLSWGVYCSVDPVVVVARLTDSFKVDSCFETNILYFTALSSPVIALRSMRFLKFFSVWCAVFLLSGSGCIVTTTKEHFVKPRHEHDMCITRSLW